MAGWASSALGVLLQGHRRVLNSLGSHNGGRPATAIPRIIAKFQPRGIDILPNERTQALRQWNKQPKTLPKIYGNGNPPVNWIMTWMLFYCLNLCIIVLNKTAQNSQFIQIWIGVYLLKVGLLNLGTFDTFGQITFVVEAVLCIVGCLPASLASAHKVLVISAPSPSCNNTVVCRGCQVSPGRPPCPQLRSTGFPLSSYTLNVTFCSFNPSVFKFGVYFILDDGNILLTWVFPVAGLRTMRICSEEHWLVFTSFCGWLCLCDVVMVTCLEAYNLCFLWSCK